MTDQMRYDGIGHAGKNIVETPALDRLASRGVFADNFYIQAPVCVPSRMCFSTGRYAHSHKNRVNNTAINPGEIHIQEYLKREGYLTASIGKLHYYPPTRQHAVTTGFDYCLLHDGTGPQDQYSSYCDWLKSTHPDFHGRHRETIENPHADQNPFTAKISLDAFESVWVGESTRDFIINRPRKDAPFYIFCSFFKPHEPFEVPEPYASLYNSRQFQLPKFDENNSSAPLPVERLRTRYNGAALEYDNETLMWIYRSYYANISLIDREVGKILDTLNGERLLDSTIVIFTSDHGDQLMEHGIMGKNVFYEGSTHVPLAISWGENLANGHRNELLESVDILPTLLDLANLEIPRHVQGRSFANLILKDPADPYHPKEAVFAENIIPEVITGHYLDIRYEKGRGVMGIRHPDAKMIRTPEWKLSYYVGNGCELFNMIDDERERHNLYGRLGYGKICDELTRRLLDWMITADETEQVAECWSEYDGSKTSQT